MEEMELRTIIINLLISAFIYMVVPVIVYFRQKEGTTKKKVLTLVIVNSAIIYFFILYTHIRLENYTTPNALPPFFYGYINYLILAKNIKEEKINDNDNQELEGLIRKLEAEKEETKDRK